MTSIRLPHLWIGLAAAGLLAGLFILRCATAQTAPASDPETIAEGKYLAAAGDCVACHTAAGGTPFAGGTVIETPFGKLLGPNLTPDKATGIGNWTDDEFVGAVKYGVGHNGVRLYPGMPYVYFNVVPRADILKIRAYLNTLPPVHNTVIADQLPFPLDIRLSMIGWNLLFFPKHGDYQPDTNQSAEWNRGAYLVQGLGHCAACHTPKNILGGDHTSQEFEGYVVENANAPALVNSTADGLGAWSADDIAAYLKSGHNAYADASGPMASVITHSTSQLTLADDHAMAVYLKSLPAGGEPTPTPIAATDPVMLAGAQIYGDECSACHMTGGTGVPGIIPALKANPVVTATEPATLTRVVLNGARSVATAAAPTESAMPPFRGILDDQQIADVLTYVRNSFGNAAPAVPAEKVTDAR